MYLDIDKLSNNPTELKGTILSLNTAFLEEKRQSKIKIDILEEKIRLLQNKLFGRKSEKNLLPSDYEQLKIFNTDFHRRHINHNSTLNFSPLRGAMTGT